MIASPWLDDRTERALAWTVMIAQQLRLIEAGASIAR
jgi:hypothetical protein